MHITNGRDGWPEKENKENFTDESDGKQGKPKKRVVATSCPTHFDSVRPTATNRISATHNSSNKANNTTDTISIKQPVLCFVTSRDDSIPSTMIRQAQTSTHQKDKDEPDTPSDEADQTHSTVALPDKVVWIADGRGSAPTVTLTPRQNNNSNNGAATDITTNYSSSNETIERNVTETWKQIRSRKTWDDRYTDLTAYLEKHRIWPQRTGPESKPLHKWLKAQREYYKKGNLTPEKMEQLQDLGFSWEGAISNVPFHPRRSPSRGNSGVDGISGNAKDAHHENNHVFSRHEFRSRRAWDSRYSELVAYLKEHKTWPGCFDHKWKKLYAWLLVQRKSFRKDKLSVNKKQLLDDLGFSWEGTIGNVPFHPRGSPSLRDNGIDGISGNIKDDPSDNAPVFCQPKIRSRKTWDDRYTDLTAYLEKHRIWPQRTGPESKPLHKWLKAQREYYKKGNLTPEKMEQLQDLGFSWEGAISNVPFHPRRSPSRGNSGVDGISGNAKDAHHENNHVFSRHEFRSRRAWDSRYSELVAYLKEHKTWPGCFDHKWKKLYAWLLVQRKSFRKDKLSVNKKQLLDDLGFSWEGTIGNVPFHPRGSPSLRDNGIDSSRDNSEDVQHENNAVLNPHEPRSRKTWDNRYFELVVYLEKHNAWPPINDPECKSLCMWLSNQRKDNKHNRLTPDRKKQLDNLGFLWSGHFCGIAWHPHSSQIGTTASTDQGRSVRPGQDSKERVDDVKDNSDDNDPNNNNNDDDDESSCDYLDDEERDYDDDEQSIDECYAQNNNNNNSNDKEEGINDENADRNESHQYEERRPDQLNNIEHQSDYNTDDSSSCSDIIYHHPDEDEDNEDDDEYANNKDAEVHYIQQHPSHPCVPLVTSSGGEAQNGGELSQHNQDTIVTDRIESSMLPLQQRDTIRTTVARLPSGDEEDHQELSGMSGLDSVSLRLPNQQIQLYRVSREEPGQLCETDLSNLAIMGNSGGRKRDVDEDDRKMFATDDDDEISDDEMFVADSRTTVADIVQLEPDGCGSSSGGSRKRRGMDPPESGVWQKRRMVKSFSV